MNETTTTLEIFDQIDGAARSGGAEEVFETLRQKFLADKNYPALFETHLMKVRHELGLPLLYTPEIREQDEKLQQRYDQASVAAARETGHLYLADGEIERAWPYFRAISEPAPVAEAIEKLAPREEMDSIIEIAFHEAVHPRKGFELILENHGICRAITCFGQYPAKEGRLDCAHLLVRTLYRELAENLKRTVTQQEGQAPETDSIAELIAGRDWLFEGGGYYIDTSHVASVIQLSPEIEDPRVLRLAVELTQYGRRLAPMYHFPGQPPFENLYEDYGIYLRALLGEDVDRAISHFEAKAEAADLEAVNWAPVQALVLLLVRLERLSQAAALARRYLKDVDPRLLVCPAAAQLCQRAGEYAQLKELARETGDPLAYAAGALRG